MFLRPNFYCAYVLSLSLWPPTFTIDLNSPQKLVPAFREGLQKADISVSLNSGITKQISVPQLGDDLFEDGDFADRWVRALDEMEMEQLIDSKK